MAKEFDTTFNSLIDAYFTDWANYLAARVGVPPGPARALDTDLASTLQADRLFRIDGEKPSVLHLELESSGRLGIPEELLAYNVLARRANRLPVHSVVMMLRPKATASDLSGELVLRDAQDQVYLTFRYTVVKLWQEPFDRLLAGGIGLAPLALLTDEASVNLPLAGDRFRQWLKTTQLPHELAKQFFGYTQVLCGLRYSREEIQEIRMGGRNVLEDSWVYQDLIREGREIGEREGRAAGQVATAQVTIHRLGTKRFGRPPEAIEARLQTQTDADRLSRIIDRLLDATSWNDLLDTP